LHFLRPPDTVARGGPNEAQLEHGCDFAPVAGIDVM